jgi:VWFA-related protein
MKRIGMARVLLCALACGSTIGVAQEPPREAVEVRLMLVDATVTDAAGRPVRGLARDDFQMTVRNTIKPFDTFDEACAPEGGAIPGLVPRVVVAFDYYGLAQRDRARLVERAADMLRERKTPGELVMIASLTNVLRVEQRFTDDLDLLLETLERMKYDTTLAAQQFSHLSAKQYFEGLATLLDVLAAHDGTKAVLLYSATVTAPDGATDDLYRDLTARAAVGRSVIYPAGLTGLTTETPRPGERVLARLATDTGGRVGESGLDASKLYDDLRYEMTCRYTLGFYLDPDQARAPEDIVLTVRKPDVTVRYPAQIRLWSVEETLASRQRAAFAEPQQFENPLLRLIAYPAGPDSTTTWSTIIALYGRLPVGPQGETLDVAAALYRDGAKIADFSRRIDFAPAASGPGTQPFTLFGEARAKRGEHELRVVLSKPGEKRVVASAARFDLPEVPWGELLLRGPLLARVEAEGQVIRAGKTEGVLLRETIGDQSFEPLIVHEIRPTDTLLVGWQACNVKGKDALTAGATVERAILGPDGSAVHALPPIPLQLAGTKAVQCHRALDRIEPGTLGPGEYRVRVAVTRDGGKVLEESAPLLVD